MVIMSKARIENRPLPKRFYAAAKPAPHDDAFVITLDGKHIRTPQQKLLHTKSETLAFAIAAEWDAQIDFIDTDTMPLTRLLNIALDRVALDRERLLADIVGYAETDLLCYRAPHTPCSPLEGEPNPSSDLVGGAYAAGCPPTESQVQFDSPSRGELRTIQAQHFGPILDWAKAHYGLEFNCTEGLMPVPQPEPSLHKIAALFAAANNHELAALALITPILGSALLTLALWKGRIRAEAALEAAHLDETLHAAVWGNDPDTVAKWAAKCRDVKAAAVFLAAHA